MTIIPADYGWIIGFNRNAPDFSPYPYLGIDARNADQVAMYQTVPALPVEIVLGRYAPDTVAGRLAECAECTVATAIEQDGVSFRAWGKDAWCEDNWCDLNEKLHSKLKPPAFDYLGHGGRIWVGDGFAVRTSQTADMQEVIRVSSGRAPSLADDEGYVLAARALSDLGVTSALFSAVSMKADRLFEQLQPLVLGSPEFFQTSEDQLRERLHQGPLLEPFEITATGTGFDGANRYTALVLVHQDAAAAAANVVLLRQRIEGAVQPLDLPWFRESIEAPRAEPRSWKETIERYEVTADGRVLVAKLYAGWLAPQFLMTTFIGDEPLTPLSVHR